MLNLFENYLKYKCIRSKTKLTKRNLDDFIDGVIMVEKLRENPYKYDGIIICLFGHGLSNNEFETSDFKTRNIDYIKSRFNGDNLDSFNGIPKIFIIDICRGIENSKEHQKRKIISYDAIADFNTRSTKNEKIWCHTDHDFYTIYSTTPGYKAPDCSYLTEHIYKTMKKEVNINNTTFDEILNKAHHEIRKITGSCCIQQIHTLSYHILFKINKNNKYYFFNKFLNDLDLNKNISMFNN